MTARQLDFITTLAAEKDLDGLSPEQRVYVGRVVAGQVDPNPAAASRIITALLALPAIVPTGVAATLAAVDVAAGRYALVDEHGVVKFYSVDRPTEGRWAGRTFVNAVASDERHPIRNRESRNAILAAIAEQPERAMRLYAAELGRCGYCGRTLTDETSRAAGIGPDCADRHGIDRSVWAEQARREQADRVRSVYTDDTATPEEDGVATDVEWSNRFAEREAQQERAAYAAEMEMESAVIAAEERQASVTRRDPSSSMTWQQRRAAVAEQQGRDTIVRDVSQITSLPGDTWEDIFGGRA